MTQKDMVSIIMPVYNNEKYITKSIRSVINQTYKNWELIIIDDCSTDRTAKFISNVKDGRIRYYRNKKNLGAAVSRNFGLRKALGHWIAFLDGDDLWHPKKLEKQISFMVENKYKFSCTNYRTCLNGEWLPYINVGPKVVDKRKLYNWCWFSTITVMYDREHVGLIQIEDLKKNNDYAMWFKIIEKANCYRLNDCLSYYIKHENSISSGKKYKLIKYHYIMFRRALNKNPLIACMLTGNNIVWGIIKKIVYKKHIKRKKRKL